MFCYRKCREKLESSADTFKFKRRKNLKKGKQITETCDKFYVVNGRTSRNTNKNFKTWNPDFFSSNNFALKTIELVKNHKLIIISALSVRTLCV